MKGCFGAALLAMTVNAFIIVLAYGPNKLMCASLRGAQRRSNLWKSTEIDITTQLFEKEAEHWDQE